jgi:transcriptional regulator with XRE-family HTH domain
MNRKSAHSIQVKFGQAVRKQRYAIEISQEELAFRAGLHRTYIGDIERGSRNISLKNIQKLSNALGISLEDLLGLLNLLGLDKSNFLIDL